LANPEQWVRFDPMFPQPDPQGIDCRIWQGCWFATRAADHRQCARNAEDAYPFGPIDANKDVAGEEGKLERHPGSVTPFPVGPVQGKVVLNFTLLQMLSDPLFMAAGRVDSEPPRSVSYLSDSGTNIKIGDLAWMYVALQSFAVLTWVKVIHRSVQFIVADV
jgi:hypothetical protein